MISTIPNHKKVLQFIYFLLKKIQKHLSSYKSCWVAMIPKATKI